MTWIHRGRPSAPASAMNEPPSVDWRNVTTSVTRPGRTPARARRARRSSTGSSSSGSVGMPSHPARICRPRSGTAAVARARLRSWATTLPASTAARAAAPVATPKTTRTPRPLRARSRDPASQTGNRARRSEVTTAERSARPQEVVPRRRPGRPEPAASRPRDPHASKGSRRAARHPIPALAPPRSRAATTGSGWPSRSNCQAGK